MPKLVFQTVGVNISWKCGWKPASKSARWAWASFPEDPRQPLWQVEPVQVAQADADLPGQNLSSNYVGKRKIFPNTKCVFFTPRGNMGIKLIFNTPVANLKQKQIFKIRLILRKFSRRKNCSEIWGKSLSWEKSSEAFMSFPLKILLTICNIFFLHLGFGAGVLMPKSLL